MLLRVWGKLPWLFALLLAVLCSTGKARAKPSSIRTAHATPASRSTGSPVPSIVRKSSKVPERVYPCSSDLECGKGSFCHAPSRNPSPQRCHTCRQRKRRCHRDAMCCPVNHCSNNICTPLPDSVMSHHITTLEEHARLPPKKEGDWRKIGRAQTKLPPSKVKGQVGDPCLRSTDCSEGLCCARHFWGRICKPVLRHGEVCTRHSRKGQHSLELFQRCDCGEGLACRALPTAQPSSSSSSSSSSSKSIAAAAKERLHLCQRE
ncbi:dickkopf-related protein 2-like [Coregonus clupeaformis]|uniref:dickkopf-related protein 2-like n=1 Tax=Coregonus clupeaformis TaxID=59861 RepID=UPI001E1C40DA|nr:dickkopf-related protein 2-like [Coregonus clupeaformis]